MSKQSAIELTISRYLAAYDAVLAGPDLEGVDANAPILHEWLPVLHGTLLQLRGRVQGHPRLGDTSMATSPLAYLSPDCSWARTLSRWYRLGHPEDIHLSKQGSGRTPDPVVMFADGAMSWSVSYTQVFLRHRLTELAEMAETNGQDEAAARFREIALSQLLEKPI